MRLIWPSITSSQCALSVPICCRVRLQLLFVLRGRPTSTRRAAGSWRRRPRGWQWTARRWWRGCWPSPAGPWGGAGRPRRCTLAPSCRRCLRRERKWLAGGFWRERGRFNVWFLLLPGVFSVKTRYIIITKELPETFWGGVKVLNSFCGFHNFQF